MISTGNVIYPITSLTGSAILGLTSSFPFPFFSSAFFVFSAFFTAFLADFFASSSAFLSAFGLTPRLPTTVGVGFSALSTGLTSSSFSTGTGFGATGVSAGFSCGVTLPEPFVRFAVSVSFPFSLRSASALAFSRIDIKLSKVLGSNPKLFSSVLGEFAGAAVVTLGFSTSFLT